MFNDNKFSHVFSTTMPFSYDLKGPFKINGKSRKSRIPCPLMMKVVHSLEMPGIKIPITQCNNPEYPNPQNQRCRNLKSYLNTPNEYCYKNNIPKQIFSQYGTKLKLLIKIYYRHYIKKLHTTSL